MGKREGEEGAGRRRGRGRRRRSMAAASKVASALQGEATARGFPNRNHREREEGKGNSSPGYDAAGERPRGPRHGRPRRTTPASAAGALEGLVLLSKRTGRERGRRRSSPRCEFGAKTAPNGGTTRGGAYFSGDSFLRESERKTEARRGNGGE